jgi:hypothetical protein
VKCLEPFGPAIRDVQVERCSGLEAAGVKWDDNRMETALGIALCFGFLVVIIAGPTIALLALANEDYRSVRRLFRERRFGLFSALLIMAIISVAFGVLRGMGVDFASPEVVCFGVFALGVGIVVVGLAWVAFSDRLERREAKRLTGKVRTPDIAVGPPREEDILLAELADDEPTAGERSLPRDKLD